MRRTYERTGLQALVTVENFDAVVERIDLAATKATILFQAIGMSPSLDAVDVRIRRLVNEAYLDLLACAALQEAVAETEGFAHDDWFDVAVVDLHPYDGRRIRVEIALVLA